MNLRAFTDNMQLTMLMVILCQILNTTHMLPLSSSIRRTELDLLLDPIHQEEQGELESKRVVAKSVYNTVIRVTETPCQPGHQRVKEDGPCLKKYSSPTPLFDEESRLEHLKILHKQGALNHNRNRNRPNGHRNRHRTTTPATSSTTTTELPLVMSTLHDLETLESLPTTVETNTNSVDSTTLPIFMNQDGSTDEIMYPTFPTVSATSSVQNDFTDKPATNFNSTSTTTMKTVNDTNMKDGNKIILTDSLNKDDDEMTTIKLDSAINGSSNKSTVVRVQTSEKSSTNTMMPIGQNVTAISVTPEDRVIIPSENERSNFHLVPKAQALTLTQQVVDILNRNNSSSIKINTTEEKQDPGLLLFHNTRAEEIGEESFMTTNTPTTSSDPVDQTLPQISPDDIARKYLMDLGTKTNESTGAAVSNSSATNLLADQNLERFNYTDNLMTDTSMNRSSSVVQVYYENGKRTTDIPNLMPIEIPRPTPSTFLSSPHILPSSSTSSSEVPEITRDTRRILNSSEIVSTVSTVTDSEEIERRTTMMAEIDSEFSEGRKFVEDQDKLSTDPVVTTDSNDALIFDEPTAPTKNEEEANLKRNEEMSPLVMQLQKVQPSSSPFHEQLAKSSIRRKIEEELFEVPPQVKSPEVILTHSQEAEIEQIHHRSKTRNRIRNPDFLEHQPQQHEEDVLQGSHEILRNYHNGQSQSQSRRVSVDSMFDPVAITSTHPSQFISFDYLKLGENHRRFRVF